MIAQIPHRNRRGRYLAPHCLLIEQDVHLLAVLIELFAGAGYDVAVALHGDDLQRAVAESRPRLVVVSDGPCGTFDSGWRAGRALRAADATLPLVMLTSDREALAELGNTPRGSMFAAGLRKPFPVSELLAVARRLCAPGGGWSSPLERSA